MTTTTTTIPSRQSENGAAEAVIWAKGASKAFGDQTVVHDLTFAIPRGRIFGFIGPSGAGKTTTIRLLTGIYAPSAGEVSVLGVPPFQFRPRTRSQIGYMPQHFVLYPELSVSENLNFAASIYGMNYFRRGPSLKGVLDFVELTEHRHKLARNISGGMQRRLSLATTLVHDPQVIFLDEPTAGVDPVLRRKFWDHFKELQDQGRTLFVTTQYVNEAAYCDLVGVLADGRLLVVDTPDGLRRRVFGGDVVDLRSSQPLRYEELLRLRQSPLVLQGQVNRIGDTGVRLVVDEANTVIPALLEWSKENGLEIESIEKYLPSFDDVFVMLLEKEKEETETNG